MLCFQFLVTHLQCVVSWQAQVHRHAHNFREVQQCTLLSIKTGGCSEDCSYCPQSSRYNTGLKAQKLMNKDAVLEAARKVNQINYIALHGPRQASLSNLVVRCIIEPWMHEYMDAWNQSYSLDKPLRLTFLFSYHANSHKFILVLMELIK